MNAPRTITPDDFPDWSHAFDGEVSYPLPGSLLEPLLTASCWSAWLRVLVLAHAVGASEAQA